MAITPYMLHEAATRSSGMFSCNVAPYEFGSDDLFECSAEMAYQIANESAFMNEMFMVTDEILAEAAMNNPDRFDVINENVFSKIIEGVKKFLDKIIAMVKGIIDRIAAFFYKMTGKTDKWLKVMKPKITEVRNKQVGYENFAAEIFDYDEEYIISGMLKGIGDMVAGHRKDMAAGLEISTQLAKVMRTANNIKPVADGTEQVPAAAADDPRIKDANDLAKKISEDLTKFNDGFVKLVAGYMGTTATSDLDAVWTECVKKAHKGGTEKRDVKIGGRVDDMLSAIEKSKNTISDLKKAYEEHLKTLVEHRKSVESSWSSGIPERADVPKNVTSAAQSAVSAWSESLSKKISKYETALNSARDKNTALVQQMVQDYMTALTKFASYKAPKSTT